MSGLLIGGSVSSISKGTHMSKPLPWSPSSLDDFVSCPYAFYRKKVLKDVTQRSQEYLDYGNRVHKDFELFLLYGTPLPEDVKMHMGVLQKLKSLPGTLHLEQECAFNTKLEPCGYWDKRGLFARMKIDFKMVHGDKAKIIDWKTGKPHQKMRQVEIYALHTFALHPTVQTVRSGYYWTKTQGVTDAVYTRDQVGELWSHLTPDLKQYAEAFKTDTWQKRRSGLCKGYCDVTDCEFWSPKREW